MHSRLIGGVQAQACSEDCETTLIAVRVSNHGRADTPKPVTVEVVRPDGTVLASETLDSVESGVSKTLEFRVPTAKTGRDLVVRVSGSWVECTDVANEAVLTDLPCR